MGGKGVCDCGVNHEAEEERMATFFDALLDLFEEHRIDGVAVAAMVWHGEGNATVHSGVAFSDRVDELHQAGATNLLAKEIESLRKDTDAKAQKAMLATAPWTSFLGEKQ